MAERLNAFIAGMPIFFIGVIVVFSMLIILIGFMIALGKIMNRATQKQQMKKKEEVEATQTAAEVAPTVETKVQDDLELVAVITAAIAASLGTTSDKLQVRSLRKVQRKAL